MLRTNHEISSFPFLSFFLFFFMSYERRFQSEEIYISRRRGIFLSRPFFPLFNYSRLFPVKFFRFHILYFLRKKLGGISFSPTNQPTSRFAHFRVSSRARCGAKSVIYHRHKPLHTSLSHEARAPMSPIPRRGILLLPLLLNCSSLKAIFRERNEAGKRGRRSGKVERNMEGGREKKKRKKEKGMRIFAVPPSTWLTVPVHSRGFILPTSLPFPRLSFLLLRGDNHTSMSSGIFVAGKPRRGYPKVPHRAITLSSSFVKGASSSSGRQGTGGDRRRDRRMACKERASSVCVCPCVCVRGLKR